MRLASPAVSAFTVAAALFAWVVGGDAPLTLAYILAGAHVFALLWLLLGRARADLAGEGGEGEGAADGNLGTGRGADGGDGDGGAVGMGGRFAGPAPGNPARVTLQRGERLRLPLALRTAAPWPVAVRVAWAEGGGAAAAAFRIGAGGSANGLATRRGERVILASGPLPRGIFSLPDVELTRGDPLGLFSARQTVPVRAEAVVRPRLRLLAEESPLGQRLAMAGGSRQGVAAPEPANWTGVRPFRPGDDRRLIHWRSSARRGTLQVLDYEHVPSRGLAIAVDPDPFGRPESWEAAIEAACSLAWFAARAGLPLWLWDPAPADPGQALPWEAVEEALTRLHPRRDARFTTRLARAARAAPRPGLVVVAAAAVSPGRWQDFARLAADVPLAVVTFDGPRLVRGGAFSHFRFPDGDAFGPLAVRGKDGPVAGDAAGASR